MRVLGHLGVCFLRVAFPWLIGKPTQNHSFGLLLRWMDKIPRDFETMVETITFLGICRGIESFPWVSELGGAKWILSIHRIINKNHQSTDRLGPGAHLGTARGVPVPPGAHGMGQDVRGCTVGGVPFRSPHVSCWGSLHLAISTK